MSKNIFAKRMGRELLELCDDLGLDPDCIGKENDCFDNRVRIRSLNQLLKLFEEKHLNSQSFDDYQLFFKSTKTILTARTKEEVELHLESLTNGKKILRHGRTA